LADDPVRAAKGIVRFSRCIAEVLAERRERNEQ